MMWWTGAPGDRQKVDGGAPQANAAAPDPNRQRGKQNESEADGRPAL
jgi:hypothetical protein